LADKDGVYMSGKERNQFEVIAEFLNERITRTEAALAMNCSIRTISRIAKAVKTEGLRGVVHGNHGKVPWNKLELTELDKIKALILGPYQNFNMTHAHEYLVEKHDVEIGYTKLSSIVNRRRTPH
jgi:predicted transcriptional regulator